MCIFHNWLFLNPLSVIVSLSYFMFSHRKSSFDLRYPGWNVVESGYLFWKVSFYGWKSDVLAVRDEQLIHLTFTHPCITGTTGTQWILRFTHPLIVTDSKRQGRSARGMPCSLVPVHLCNSKPLMVANGIVANGMVANGMVANGMTTFCIERPTLA